jgi:PAS domain S-box-containing protein
MWWLASGILYSITYGVAAYLWRDHPMLLIWFRAGALLVPPLAGAIVIIVRRQTWRGCQLLFWSTIALGLTMSAIGLTGWAFDELLFGQQSWLAWPAVFALFGNVAPLFALLAQPHRGVREPLAATTAVDIAGLAVVTGFLYSFFVTAPEAIGSVGHASVSLLLVSEMQSAVVAAGLMASVVAARGTPWQKTYERLALGALVSLVTLTLSNLQAEQASYHGAFVYDFTWILPFAFFPWAAASAPASESEDQSSSDAPADLNRPRPWVIFTAVALLPFMDFGLRHITAVDPYPGFRDLSTAVTIISVLPLLVARIATERAELRQVGSTTRLLAQVLEQTQDLILVLTPDGRFRYANEAFCRVMGLSREELAGRSASDLLAHDSLSADDIQSLVRGGGTWRGTVTRTRGDGTTFPAAVSIAALVGRPTEPSYLVSVERDVSEEQRLREQLIHSERLSAVGQLVAGVAHELNNPLQSVIGTTELLIETERREETRRDLERVRSDGYRAARIVRSLLSFARRSTLERSLADLNDIARSTLVLRAYELRSLGIALDEAYSDQILSVVVNREEIQQVVLNLILNAEQAMRGAGLPGTLTIRTGSSGPSVFLEIADDGPGVPKVFAGRVFEPFFTTKDVGYGTGLGLSISLGIASAHAGSLALVPSERGACFRLTLPSESRPAVSRSPLLASAAPGSRF